MTVRINCCSGPRNISTALMYSFRERQDTTVFDEPFYAHYLNVTGREHPGREEVLKTQNPNPAQVTQEIMLADHGTPVVFFKQMAHHLIEMDRSFLSQCVNVLLVREPTEMLASLAVNLKDATLGDTGLESQVDLMEEILSEGETPVVLDATTLRKNPRNALEKFCENIGISFDEAMLSWPAGPKPEDGVWEKYWYHGVHASTGFLPYEPKEVTIPEDLTAVIEEAIPLYERLSEYALEL